MGNTTDTLPWADWIIDRYAGKSESSAYFAVHHAETMERASIERKDVYLPEELEYDLKRRGASVQDYSDYYLNEAIRRIQIAQQIGEIPGIIGIDDYKYVANIKSGYTMYIRRRYEQTIAEYQEENTLTPVEFVTGVCELCDALTACHEKSVIYGALRKESVYVTEDKHFLLGTDFFFALRAFGEKIDRFYLNGLTDSAAPESLNKATYTPASDVYTVGMFLYRFFNEDKIPFMPLTQKKRNQHIYEGAIERRLRGEKFMDPAHGTPELIEVIQKACEFEPENRYSSVAELKEELKALLKKDLVDPQEVSDDDDDVPDELISEDYKAEMAARIRAEEYRKMAERQPVYDEKEDEKEPENENPFRSKSKKTLGVRIGAAILLVGFLVIQVINSGMYSRRGAVAETETEVVTEVTTEAAPETGTEAVTETTSEAATEAVTEAQTER